MIVCGGDVLLGDRVLEWRDDTHVDAVEDVLDVHDLAIWLLARRADTNRPSNAVARLVNLEGGKVSVLVLRGEPQVAHVVADVDHRALRVNLLIFNLANSTVSDIDYYFASRLPGDPAGGVDDLHTHPSPPRTARASLVVGF
jgi:hypothetical protein